jgi:hypothetical protein
MGDRKEAVERYRAVLVVDTSNLEFSGFEQSGIYTGFHGTG